MTYRSRYNVIIIIIIIIIIICAIQVPSFQPSLFSFTPGSPVRGVSNLNWQRSLRHSSGPENIGAGANLRDTSEMYLGYELMGFCGWDLFMVIQAILQCSFRKAYERETSLGTCLEQTGTRFWAGMKGCCKEPASGIAPTVFPLIVADFKHSLLLSYGTGTVT